MVKNLINSEYMKWFRLSFLKKIHNDILTGETRYCCLVSTWHKSFICWKDLKEVKENHYSKYIRPYYSSWELTCSNVWFEGKEDRLNFLNECISKLENK
jgi:hypothetical protein